MTAEFQTAVTEIDRHRQRIEKELRGRLERRLQELRSTGPPLLISDVPSDGGRWPPGAIRPAQRTGTSGPIGVGVKPSGKSEVGGDWEPGTVGVGRGVVGSDISGRGAVAPPKTRKSGRAWALYYRAADGFVDFMSPDRGPVRRGIHYVSSAVWRGGSAVVLPMLKLFESRRARKNPRSN